MYLFLKKSKLTRWWVCDSKTKMAFVNILSKENLTDNLLVIGYLNESKQELATSSNKVVKVTKKGVITAKGSFYPFETAHNLYLNFLIEANKPNTLIATNWEYASKLSTTQIIADIISKDGIQKGVTFDFNPSKNDKTMSYGFSKNLNSNIVLTTFAKRNICIAIKIPDYIKAAIYSTSLGEKDEILRNIQTIQSILKH